MVEITKEEAMLVRSRFPDIYVARTKHKYFVPELIKVLRILPNNPAARSIVNEHDKNRRGRSNGRNY